MPRNITAYGIQTASAITLTATTQSTSTTTGTLIVGGGIGIGGNLHVAGTITGGSVSYSSTSSGTFDVTNATGTTLTVDSTEQSTSTTTGCATFAGGVGIAGNVNIGGTLTAGSITYASTSTGTLAVTTSPGTTMTVSSTTDSTTTTNGSTTFAGGIGVAKRINSGSLAVFDATQSTSTSTGALIVSNGGIGAAGNIYAGGAVNSASVTTALLTNTGNTTSGGFDFILGNTDQVTRGSSGQSRALVKGAATALILNFAGDFTGGVVVQGTTQSTSPTTGAFRVNGGQGLEGNLYVGGLINSASSITGTSLNGTNIILSGNTDSTAIGNGNIINPGGFSNALRINTDSLRTFNATNSTSSSTGALVVTNGGGLGVGGNIHSGGSLNSVSLTTGGVTCTSVTSSGNIQGTGLTGTTLTLSSNATITGAVNAGSGTISGTLNIGTAAVTQTNTTNFRVLGTTNSTSVTTGAAIIDGGLGVSLNISGSTMRLYGSTNSTSKTTGTQIIDGGLGVNLNISAGSMRIYDTTISTSGTTGALIVDGSIGTRDLWSTGNITNGGYDFILGNTDQVTRGNSGASRAMIKDFGNELALNFQGEFTGGTRIDSKLRILSTGEAATLTSSLYTLGGIRAEKNIWSTTSMINGGFEFILGNTDQVSRGNSGSSRALVKNPGPTLIINFAGDFTGGVVVQGTTDATSSTTGAFRINGGASVEKNFWVGENITANNFRKAWFTEGELLENSISLNRNQITGGVFGASSADAIFQITDGSTKLIINLDQIWTNPQTASIVDNYFYQTITLETPNQLLLENEYVYGTASITRFIISSPQASPGWWEVFTMGACLQQEFVSVAPPGQSFYRYTVRILNSPSQSYVRGTTDQAVSFWYNAFYLGGATKFSGIQRFVTVINFDMLNISFKSPRT